MRITALASAVAALFLVPGAIAASDAQEVLRAPAAIRSCLCQEQSVSTLANDVLQQNKVYEDRRKTLESLDSEVRARRAQINVANQSEVDAFKNLLDQRDRAADGFAGEVTRSYSDAVTRYNQSVAEFNAGCAGKAYDQEVLREVRANLSCPKP
jgi:uncharacterized protein YukE